MPSHLGQVPGWSPSITVSQILVALVRGECSRTTCCVESQSFPLISLLRRPQQELLCTPNFGSVLGQDAYAVKSTKGRAAYDERVRQQAMQYAEAAADEE